ncbi:MAG TPA: sulfurtransferase [Candidatus Limnocylindrales bacterium]
MSLIAPEALLGRLDDTGLRIADVRWWLADPGRGRRAYAEGHLPSAIFVDVDTELVAADGPGRHPLPSPAIFSSRMEALGFDDESDIVAYDDAGGTIAARLWWMFDALGHRRVSVLDGGFQAWVAAGGPVTASVSAHPRGRLTLDSAWTRTIDREGLAPLLGTVAVIDARAPERYRGEVEPIDPVAGHIPTAINCPTGGNLAADGRFLPPGELRRRFQPLGDELVMTCGSGITACHNALAMRVAGLPDPLLYPGSYSDWSRAGLPVATGDAPGVAPGPGDALR